MAMRNLVTKLILIATLLATNVLAGALAGYWLHESRQHYEKRAEALTQNRAFAVAENLTGLFDKTDLMLQMTVEETQRRNLAFAAESVALTRLMESHVARLPELAAIGVLDRDGRLVLSAGGAVFSETDMQAESFFAALRDQPTGGLQLSLPNDTVIAGRTSLVFARRIDKADGSMGGLALAALPLDHIVQLIGQHIGDARESLTLRDANNVVIARFPVVAAGQPGAIGSAASSPGLRQAVLTGEKQGTQHSAETYDRVPRTFSFRRLEVAPLYVVAGVPEEEYLAEWRAERQKTIIFLAAFFLVTTISGGLIYRLFIIASQQSRRNRMFLERATDGVHVLDSQGTLVEASDSFCAMLGYRREELIGKDISTWEVKYSRNELVTLMFPKLLRSKKPTVIETIHRRKDGSMIAVEIHATAVHTHRESYLYASSSDITERNRLKAEIDAALMRFEAIFQNNPLALCMIDFTSGTLIDVNPAWEQLFGYQREEVIGRHSLDLGLWADPGQRKRVLESMTAEGMVGPWEGQQRRADGQLIYCALRGRLLPVGDEKMFLWAFEDIAERKKTEVGLRLAASVFDFSHDGIMITDGQNQIIEINPAFTRITGYQREEVLERNPSMLGAAGQNEEPYEQMRKSLAASGSWRGEIWNKRKSGEIYPVLLSIAVIRDNDGQVQRYIGVFSDISQIKEHEKELHRVAHYDPLTGLPNRRLLADRMNQAIARARRHSSSLAVCFVDLDGFKEVNDTLGHEVGDQLLVAVANHIQKNLRADDTLARLGGDEFVILLNNCGSEKDCFQVLDRVLAAIIAAAGETHPGITLSASIGITLFPKDDADADTLLRHADQAMYRAKEAGKGRFHKFDPERDRQVRASHEALQRLKLALEREEFVLYFQPKVNMTTGEVIGAEALVRWQDPERGVISPGSFMPMLAGTDLEIPFGDYIFEAALAQCARWKSRGLLLPISVNVSPNHLQAPNFADRLQTIMARHPLVTAGDLQLEVVESTEIGDIKRAATTLEQCRKMGVSFALDDFGTGYSSLTYFRKLPIDILKIDQSFVRDMLNHPEDLRLVAGIIHLAEAFNRPVIAEGVETEQHGSLLVKLGCSLGQGYGIARPMPADLLEGWIAQWQGEDGWRIR